MRFPKLLKSLDFILLIVVLLILVMGFFVLQSATQNASVKHNIDFVQRQMAWAVIGLIAFFSVLMIDYEKISKYSLYIYLLNLALLVAVLV